MILATHLYSGVIHSWTLAAITTPEGALAPNVSAEFHPQVAAETPLSCKCAEENYIPLDYDAYVFTLGFAILPSFNREQC
jgi:hypothetical protein